MTQTEPAALVARSRDDLLAMVPMTLGFVPAESVTMLTFAATRAFHARIDLPDHAVDDPALVDALLEPALRHGVGRVVFVVHSTRAERFREAATTLLHAFLDARIDVVDVLRADGERCWCLHCGPEHGTCAGHPYDVSTHPFAVRAVVDGRVVHRSREELADTLVPDVAAKARRPAVREAALRHGGVAPYDLPREADWLRTTVRRHVRAGTRPDDVRLGRLLADLGTVALRDAVWERMGREEARAHVELWRDAVRRAPRELRGPAAGVLAYAAWLAGDGALAWCAVDRGRATSGDLDLLAYVSELLSGAVSPCDAEAARRPGLRPGVGGREDGGGRVVVPGPW